MILVYEVTPPDFDGATDETDAKVRWILSPSLGLVQTRYPGCGVTPLPVPADCPGVDAELVSTAELEGRRLVNAVRAKEPNTARVRPLDLITHHRIQVGPDGTDRWCAFVHENIFKDDGSGCPAAGATPCQAVLRCVALKHYGPTYEQAKP